MLAGGASKKWSLSETVESGRMSFIQDVCGELRLQHFQPWDESPALPRGPALQRLHCLELLFLGKTDIRSRLFI